MHLEVASFTDAWIETAVMSRLKDAGLKSHLLQMRGLKQNQLYKHYRLRQVASFTDAWIETLGLIRDKTFIKSHLLQMRGLKHPFEHGYRRNQCRIFYRCVD